MKLDTVERLVKGDAEAEALYRNETTRAKAGDPKSRAANTDNVSIGKPEHSNVGDARPFAAPRDGEPASESWSLVPIYFRLSRRGWRRHHCSHMPP